MRTSNTQLFLQNLEHLVESYKESYTGDVRIRPKIIKTDNGLNIYNEENPAVLSNNFLQLIDDASRHIAACSYYVMYDSNREIPVVHVI
jgi:hypothetical protein